MKGLSVLAAVVVLLPMVHAWGGFSTRVSPLASCELSCDGVDSYHFVPDPVNCTNYYVCQLGVPYGPIPCESGNYFDADTSECKADDGIPCERQCGGEVTCPLTCNGTVYEIGDAFDCSIYYYCIAPGVTEPHYCYDPERPYYDGNTRTCTHDASVCCSGYCTPYCTGGGYFAPDPNSCTEFYFCEEEGVPSEDHNLPCADGHFFNVHSGLCEKGPTEPCYTLCDAVTGGGGSSSTTPGGGSSSTTPGGGGSTDINGCVSSLVCPAPGYFAACSTCHPAYFECSSAGTPGVLDRCPDGYTFNPLPESPICVLEGDCPYYPTTHYQDPYPFPATAPTPKHPLQDSYPPTP